MVSLWQLPDYLRELNVETVILRLVLSFILSGFIGFERERRGRAAGLRTHILVCLGAAMTTMIGTYAKEFLNSASDPMRMGAQVISGIGFLGAGTILVKGNSHIMGLTTAAGLWTTATIGLAIGAGFYEGGIIATIVAIIAIAVLNRVEIALLSKKNIYRLYIEISDVNKVNQIMEDIKAKNYIIKDMDIKPARSAISDNLGMEELTLILRGRGKNRKVTYCKNDVIGEILKLEGVAFALEIF